MRRTALTSFLAAVGLAVLTLPVRAEDFSVQGVGIAFSLPAGWHYTGRMADQISFRRFAGPEGVVMVHPANPDAKSPEEALALAATHIAERNQYRQVRTTLLDSKPFLTAAGQPGMQGVFGTRGSPPPPSVVMHFVSGTGRHIACICVMSCGTNENFALLERAMIESIHPLTPGSSTALPRTH